ncbi:hypothetical protein K6U06_03120 [Acidiferrimicrobium sp. IK]|uniref:hypothetical protein n=1 Tax=Acidiferrimicrobium sp. IK TaxID=2871700 RepID=UPI0021CB5C27|nr:hypothetical protein [Acidiferrimicrobium sp. IK]MCU4183336.1 hypothetical protein [Acidiferrimicrobium sp. IK]
MRTTVTIDDRLLEEAKALAAASKRTIGDVVDDGLRLLLAQRERTADVDEVDLPVDGGTGLRAGVDLEDKARLRELLGDDASPADAATPADD